MDEGISDFDEFASQIESHRDRLYGLALDLTGRRPEAEDLLHDILVTAFERREAFRGESTLYTWLYRIMVNTYLNTKRGPASRTEPLDQPISGNHETGPGHRIDRSYAQARIDAALDELSPRERVAFVLKHFHDRPIRAVAEQMDVAPGTVKSFLYRSYQKLREELGDLRDLEIE